MSELELGNGLTAQDAPEIGMPLPRCFCSICAWEMRNVIPAEDVPDAGGTTGRRSWSWATG